MLMAWCFSTRASVATVLTTHPCVSRCLGVNTLKRSQMAATLQRTLSSVKSEIVRKSVFVSANKGTNLCRGFTPAGWRHHMEAFFMSMAICAENSPVTGEFPAQRPVTGCFDVFFDQRLNKRLSKQSWGWWFRLPSHHYDVTVVSQLSEIIGSHWL